MVKIQYPTPYTKLNASQPHNSFKSFPTLFVLCHSNCLLLTSFSHSPIASSHSLQSSPHLSPTIFQLLALTILSTPLSCLTTAANRSVLASRGKNRAEYGSSLSSTILCLSLSLSNCLKTASGSSGSGLVATDAQ